MSTKNIRNGYDNFYETKFTKGDDWSNSSVIWHPRRWVAYLAEKEKGRYLIIGCGILNLKILQSDRKDVIGIDISKVALKTAKKLGVVILADGTQLPFRDSSFNSICAFDVLEHVPNKIKMITEAKRGLINGGKIFLSVPIKIKGTKGDERQPFDEPPTFVFLIRLVTSKFDLSIVRGFGGRNPLNRVPYKVFCFLSFFFKYFPYFLIDSRYISIVATKSVDNLCSRV